RTLDRVDEGVEAVARARVLRVRHAGDQVAGLPAGDVQAPGGLLFLLHLVRPGVLEVERRPRGAGGFLVRRGLVPLPFPPPFAALGRARGPRPARPWVRLWKARCPPAKVPGCRGMPAGRPPGRRWDRSRAWFTSG